MANHRQYSDPNWQAKLQDLSQSASTTYKAWVEAMSLQRTRADVYSTASPRPFFVEFSGTPKSGKSSTIEKVRQFFRRNRFRVLAPAEGASRRTPDILKDDLPLFNVWSGCYSLSHLLEKAKEDAPYDLVLLDRGLFDVTCWVEYLGKTEQISSEERTIVREFFLLERWKTLIDMVVLMTVQPNTALEREYSESVTLEYGRAMRPDFLRDINEVYHDLSRQIGPSFPKFLHLETEGPSMTLQSGVYTIVAAIVEEMKARADRIKLDTP